METTNIKLARTKRTGDYLNPDPNYLSFQMPDFNGNGAILDAKPWVQSSNRQLWIDEVCINPHITTKAVAGTSNNYDIISASQSLTQTNECVMSLSFDKTAFVNFMADEHILNTLSVNYFIRDANGDLVISNNVPETRSFIMYKPFDTFSDTLLGQNLKVSSGIINNKNTYRIDSEYIDSIDVMTGTSLYDLVESGSNDAPKGISTSDINVNLTYLVITSTFGNVHAIELADINGAAVSTAHLEASITNDSNINSSNAYNEARAVKLYTTSQLDGVQLMHTAPSSGVGTDVHFRTPTAPAVGNNPTNVEIVISVIDGGEIADPNANQ